MEKKETSIFYLGIAQGESFTGGRRERKSGLPIRAAENRLEYPGGYIKVFYAMLPEFSGRKLGSRKGKAWKPKVKQQLLQRTLEKVREESTYSEILLTSQLSLEKQEVPIELQAAYLHRHAPFDRVYVCFSGEGGTFEAREAILLLSPYLKRMRQVVLSGKESAATELFSEYLYYEYGIVPERKRKMVGASGRASEKPVVLDLGNRAAEEGVPLGACQCINNEETLKFLDTTIKNGYNTES